MKQFFTALLAILLISVHGFSQDFEKRKVQVLDKNIEINSFFGQIDSKAYTRNYAVVDLPDNCYGFAYSIIITKKDAPVSRKILFEALAAIPDKRVQVAGQLGELIMNTSTGDKIDVYIMNTRQDLEYFYEKKSFTYCDQLLGTNNNCYISTTCRSAKRIYFGLVNNKALQGFIVNLQVVAYYLNPVKTENSGEILPVSRVYSKSQFVGTYRDDNSTFTMYANGNFFILWDDTKTASGIWDLNGDKLNFDMRNVESNPYKRIDYYKIISWDGTNLKYQSLRKSAQTYNAKKISP